MKYHCGLLDPHPEDSRTLKWIRATRWGHLPPEMEHELRVWLAMPGFTVTWQAHAFNMGRRTIEQNIGGFDRYKADVIENWLSATREDCIRLCRMRPGMGDVPVISQVRAIEDLKTMTVADVARDYGLTGPTIARWKRSGLRFRNELPSGFGLLVA